MALLLGNSHRMRLVEAKHLTGLKCDCRPRVADLYSIEFHASLFDQAGDFAMGLLKIEYFAINIRNEGDGCESLLFSC